MKHIIIVVIIFPDTNPNTNIIIPKIVKNTYSPLSNGFVSSNFLLVNLSYFGICSINSPVCESYFHCHFFLYLQLNLIEIGFSEFDGILRHFGIYYSLWAILPSHLA